MSRESMSPEIRDLEDALAAALARNAPLCRALCEFVETINSTGGVILHQGTYAPVADEDWTALGDAYRSACEVLDVEPKEICECGRRPADCTATPENPEHQDI